MPSILGVQAAFFVLATDIAVGAAWHLHPAHGFPTPAPSIVTGQLASAAATKNPKSNSPASEPSAGQVNEWPRWRGADGTGVSKETTWTTSWPKEGPTQLWKASVGIGFSSFAVAQGRAYTLGNAASNDTVFCFDAVTGKELWKHSYPAQLDPNYYEGGPSATPTVDGQRVFTVGKHGNLFCFEASTGKVIWQKNLIENLGATKPDWGFAGSPVVEGNLLLLNAGGAGTALSKADGSVVWTSGTNVAGYATPVLYGSGADRAAVIFSGNALLGLRVADGRELWRRPWVEEFNLNSADPIFTTPNSVFISSYTRGSALLRFGEAGVSEVWTNKNMAVGFNSCVLLDGHLYGVHGTADGPEKEVRCVDAATGELKWKQEKFGLGSVTAADGKLILLSERGELFVAEASPFKPLARAQVLGGKCWTTPVLANGRIYCRNAKGNVVCLDVRGGESDPSALRVLAREPKNSAK
jgi:outer membrane protein assembly factor BamB